MRFTSLVTDFYTFKHENGKVGDGTISEYRSALLKKSSSKISRTLLKDIRRGESIKKALSSSIKMMSSNSEDYEDMIRYHDVKGKQKSDDEITVCIKIVACVVLVPVCSRSTMIEVIGKVTCHVNEGSRNGIANERIETLQAFAKDNMEGWLEGVCTKFRRSTREMEIEQAEELAKRGFEGMAGGIRVRQAPDGTRWSPVKR